MGKIQTRIGNGIRIEMTEAEVKKDLAAGTEDAADRAKIPPLTEDELRYLFEIHKCPDRVVGVERGKEVCLTYDSCTTKIKRPRVSQQDSITADL